jgi:hypothetical protein
VEKLKAEVRRMKGSRTRKSREPMHQFSDYLCVPGEKRKERRSGKLLSKEMRESRSNMKT